MKGEIRQSPIQEMLLLQDGLMEVAVQLVEGFVELARQLGEDPFKPKIMA